jgi:hypothetical protein
VTIWQRGHLNVIDHTAFPVEFLKPCADAGYAVTQKMLNPQHPSTSLDQVPLSYLHQIRSTPMKAFGFVWADDFQSPEAMFNFVRGWRQKSLDAGCALTGFVINAEDGWEAHDLAGEQWSKRFLDLFRSHPLTMKLSLALNTYNGGGGIALYQWMRRGARLYYQTFHEAVTHEWPIDGGVTWAAQYGYTKRAMVKPNWGTYNPYPNRAEQIASAVRAGTDGFSAWYAEGAGDPQDVLIPLLREARAAGVCA